VLEVELMPADGYWLKVLDADGNYLSDVSLTFKQGDAVPVPRRVVKMVA
jgi:hypothetical protein